MKRILILMVVALFAISVCLPAPAQAGAKGRANTAIIIGSTALALSILGFGGGREESRQVVVVQPRRSYGGYGQLDPREEAYNREMYRLQREAERKWVRNERISGRQQARDDFYGR